MDGDLGRQVPALIAVFELAGMTVALQRVTKVVWPHRSVAALPWCNRRTARCLSAGHGSSRGDRGASTEQWVARNWHLDVLYSTSGRTYVADMFAQLYSNLTTD